eukprot:CAMPEP_0119366290 /NCGR_PEP_ID=MMETSP1334-20130426/13161_1 /TAXON_ID=127549 /ORGANISM="Calcidiscus leptoporus, Strain RCC1130" /LENGTH=81 /DNA_ID=CAMNT_0007382465 /DNA_START=1 /DNA_END=243 /DNA_ORIENTATION=-
MSTHGPWFDELRESRRARLSRGRHLSPAAHDPVWPMRPMRCGDAACRALRAVTLRPYYDSPHARVDTSVADVQAGGALPPP